MYILSGSASKMMVAFVMLHQHCGICAPVYNFLAGLVTLGS